MTAETIKKKRQSLSNEAKMQAKKLKTDPPLSPSKKEKAYTKRELEEIQSIHQLRYNNLLNSARSGDMAAVLILPNQDLFEIPMSRVSRTLEKQGEAGPVELEAIEPGIVDIRQRCAQCTNCDETGFYLKELDTRSYTTPCSKSSAKAFRDCKVSVLFCINASGTSLSMADIMDALNVRFMSIVTYFFDHFLDIDPLCMESGQASNATKLFRQNACPSD
ncbi:hypothetical protein BGX27_006223 [Mortierella sp. AM989]|nr:hypothetical protein BGX27_006223 [Mortierella sp. AM989]